MALSLAMTDLLISVGTELFSTLFLQGRPTSNPEINRLETQLKELNGIIEALPQRGQEEESVPAQAKLSSTIQAPTPTLILPSTAETLLELKRRLAKELYRIELDLQGGARIAGKPCDCLSRGKHLGGVEATAEELMSYEANPVYGRVVEWVSRHAAEFEPTEIARREPDYYRGLTPEVRAFRKEVMGTEKLVALLNKVDRAKMMAR